MENISPEDILELLENPQLITSLSVFKTKVIAEKTITGKLIIRDRNIKETITFSNCSFEDVYIENTACPGSVEFRNCTFSNDFMIFSIKAHSILLENCTLEKSFRITNCNLLHLSIERTEALNGIVLEAGQMQIMQIRPVNEKTIFSLTGPFLLIKELYITSRSGITITARKAIINLLSLNGYFNIASRLDFNTIINKSIDINGLNNDGKIYLSNLKPASATGFLVKDREKYITAYDESGEAKDYELRIMARLDRKITANDLLMGNYPVFVFRDFIEKNFYDDFVSYEDSPEIRFQVHDSSLGILELRSVLMERYKTVITNSDLTAVRLIHTRIPDAGAADDFLNYYHVYNDLYTAAAKQNNSRDKANYYRISQHYLNEHLKSESSSNDTIGSRISISLSRFYSAHGTDWIQACWITLLAGFIFFSLYLCSLKGISADLSSGGVLFFFDTLLPFYPQFLNPIHRIDFMSEISPLGGWSALYDFLGRIFSGIGAFEIIRSFRKHVRPH